MIIIFRLRLHFCFLSFLSNSAIADQKAAWRIYILTQEPPHNNMSAYIDVA